MSQIITQAQQNAALQTFVGDLYAAIYDVPPYWSRYSWCTDLDMEPYRISRIVTLDMQIEGNAVISQSVVFFTEREAHRHSVLIAFNDVGEMIFSDYVASRRMIQVRPQITVSDF